MTSTRTRRRTTSQTPWRTVTRATAGGATLSLALLAGCEPDDRDDRPASDYATLVDELRSLPGVDSVESTPGAPDTPVADADAGPSSPSPPGHSPSSPATDSTFTVVLDPDSGEAELRTVGKRSHTLVNDHRYPSGAPEVTVGYGPFTAEIAQSRPDSEYVACADACGQDRIELTDFLDLRALPDVESGSLTAGGAEVVLAEDQDVRGWVADALETDVRTRLIVRTAQEPESRWLVLSLGADGTADAVASLFDLADLTGAEVVEASVEQSIQYPSATLRVAGPSDVPAVHDAVVAEVPDRELSGFEIVTDDGLEVLVDDDGPPIEHSMEARRLLTDARSAVTRIGGGGSYVELTVPDSEVLRSVVDTISDAAWPLPQDTSVRVSHEDSSDYKAPFSADEWDEREPLLTDLWDAGLVDVAYRYGHEDVDTTLEIGPESEFSTPAGRDALVQTLRGVDWKGTARITLASGDMPSFTTTADGRAQNPHNTASGAEADVHGWGQEFVDAWNESAS
ncbi:hypothetical protein [Brevibacterium jeotgali]|uniref:Uncharacterized protein n=1 Tax=Brevibacterium jeotgali TaxID=1262550 RepID=A0A2H1L1S3_9MICO|nr:hypothetical protein [Brevibacterium jeotgali]TWC01861.1 hypothetical protein FB108_0518 [Brevibacterium jeotgali]SMY10789.1 hypothetical protein BJEO58_00364 [Brevibacterium jeotgali]